MAEDSKINLKRSDGLHHDLVSVFSSANSGSLAETLKGSKETERAAALEATKKEDEHHGKINIRRSDGINHDIIKVFKSSSDASGMTMHPLPAPSTGTTQKRTSMSKIEVAKFIDKGSQKMFGMFSSPISGGVTAADAGKQNVLSGKTARELSNSPTSIRIVHMSNTHNFLKRGGSRQFLPEGDILIHSGGFTMNGSDEEYLQFDEWLQSISDIYHYRVVIAGKRDVKRYGNNWDEVRVSLPHATHILCHSEATIMGLRIFGSPWHWGHKANYSLRQGAPSFSRFNDIPEGVHVLITHGPSFGKLDQVGILKESIGSRDLEENIKRAKPGLHLHGLAAEGRGVLYPFGNAPMTVNSSMCDPQSTVLYACPHVVKASLRYANDVSGGTAWEFTLDNLDP